MDRGWRHKVELKHRKEAERIEKEEKEKQLSQRQKFVDGVQPSYMNTRMSGKKKKNKKKEIW